MKSLKCSHQWLKLGNMGLVGGLVVLWLLGCLVIPAAAASPGDGPGGVGETDGLSALRWWFKTDAGVYADFGCTTLASTGGLVACWADQSGHGEAVLQSDADYRPLYRTASRLEFDTAILTSTQPVQLFANPSAGLSAIVVFNTNNYTNTGVLVNHGASDGADNDLNFELGYTVGNPTQWGNFGLHRGGGRATVAPQGTITNSTLTLMSTLVLPSGTTPLTSLAIYKNGAALSLATNSGGWLTSGSYPTTAVPLDIGARRDGNDATYPDVAPDAFHSGEIAEIIIYTTTLNSAQRTIVENYLAAKYGITLNAAAAKYISLKDYNMNVAGIGREADGMHTHASSAGLQVTDAGFLQDNGDYLLIGHKSVANFIAGTQLPLGVQSRWERSWYFDFSDTGTTGGKVTLTFDFSDAGISETPSGIYVLLGRNTTASRFQIVQTSSYIVGDQVIFKDTPALRDDWYYTLGEAANRDYYIADSHQPGGPTPAFEDIRSSGILIGAFSSGSDDQTVIAPINFTFNFYDRGYVTATVSSNGFVGFNSTTAGAGTPPAIPNTANPNGVVAGWWMDLDARVAGATVHYTTTGIAPLRVFIVQYTNVPRVGTSITSTFQIKLFESTDQIEVHYLHANTNAAVGAGIENQDGVKGLQYYYANASLRDVAVRYSRPELLIDKTVNESIPRVGERITYTLVLRSNLAFATTATVVTDTLDAGLTFDTGALTIAPAQPFNYTLNGQVLELRDFNIQAGGRVTFTLPVTVSPSATPGVELTNQAVMTHSDLSELRSTMVDVMPDNCWVRVGSTTYNNLQAGLDAAAPGAEVKIAGHCVDVVARNGLEQVGYLSKTLTLRGGYAPGDVDWTTAYPTRTTVLNAHGDGRVLYMYDASASISVTLENLHLINGDAGQSGSVDSYGGGLYANAALLTLRQVQIYQNLADRGGGVYMLTGTLSLRDSRVFSNTADTRGGGLALFNVRALLWQQSEVLSNTAGLGGATAGMGGGLYLEDTPAWMQGGRIAGNQADVANKSDRGGGLYILRKSLSLTSGVSIVDNMAYWGGGVYADACVVTVTGGTVASNMAFQGAGLYLDAGASELRSNTFMGNHAWGTGDARYGGGGLYTLNVPVRLTENVFISNTAATGGAGALLEGADMFIHDNAFTTNTAARSQGGGLYIVTGSTATLTLNHFISNTAGNGGGGAYVNNTLWISVTANEFMSNTANSGGGLYLKSALMQVQDNQLVANLATSQGGGMFLERGAVVVVRNLLLRNLATASHGGGAFFSYANGQVLTNTWEFNSSGARGGGFYMGTSGSFTVRNNDFLTNTANAGGGVAIVTGIMTLEDNRFEGNIAVGGSFGGGGLLLDRTLLWMKHNVFTANTTTGNHGGALYLVQPTGGTVISNTFVNNTAPTGQGGGVYFNNVDVLTFTLNLVVENTANGAGGGAAVVNGSVGLWIVDNIVQANQHTSSANGGGGIYITGSQPNLERNQIMFNTTMRDGGGIFFGGSNGAVMTNTVISNTATRYGGGVYVGSNPMTFIGNTVTENQAEFGGGFYLYQSTGLFQRNTIRQNTSSNHGGGVYGINGRAILEDNTIDLNTTPQNGGGIYLNVPTDIAVRANRIVSNTASQGGGVYVYRGASSTVSHNTIAYNLATRLTDAGAGAYVMNLNNSGVTAFMFAYNTFRANTTPGQGGGLYINNADSATLNANQFLENTAQGGGGIWLLGSESLLTNNLLVDNIITERGSGIYVEGSSPRILHSTLVGNTGGDGSGICVTRATYFSSPMITNTIMVNQTVGVTATTGNLATLNGTLWWLNGAEWGGSVTADANYYGNPEFVNAAGGDYHITLNSPALNVGLDSGVASDMDAEPRPQYGGYDLGADEYAGSCFVKLNDDDYMYTSIQDAVDASTQATDLIKVAGTCATVKFTGGTLQTVYINKSLTIRGGYTLTEWVNPDAALYPTTLGARGLGRVAFVNVGVVTIEDVWITGGDAAAGGSSVNGGGVYVNASATLTLRNVTLENNHADNGAGVYSNYATLLVEDSLIADNGAALDGGGLYALNGQVSFLRSTLRGNTAGNGGGLYLSGSIATLRNNTWNSNSVTGEGGALYLNGVTSLAFEANLVRDNSAASGGGMYLYQSPVTLERSHFISNTVTRGGGLYLNASNAALINTVIANNTSTDRGSGIYVTASAPHLTHLTFVGNTGGDGSGVRLAGNSTAWLTNTIMTQQAAGVWAEAGSAATLNATLWWANTQNTAGSVSSTNNYSGDPVFVNPAQQNYHIALGSAAINQGVATPVLLDIDGLLRDNFPDLGADEYRTCWVRLNDSPTDYAVVQDAIAAGAHATDVIKIAGYCTDLTAQPRRDLTAAGIVSQVAYLTRTLTLQGGYTSTNFTVAYPVTQPTTLAAMDGGRVLYVSGDIAPVVRGLTLTGGNAAGQGGDAAGDAGGGVYVITGTLTLSQTALVSNTGARGGGLYVASGAAHLYNAIVAQNSATEGGGAYGLNATLLGVHTTWAENTGASGLHLTGASTAALTNTILVSHTVGIHAASGSAATLLATLWHNNTQDTGGAGAINTAQDHTGAPAFVAPAAFDYHIHFASAAIDRGVMALPVDIDQEPRPAGDASDLGADEYPAALRLTKHATSAVARAGDMLTYTLRVTNTGLLPYRASISDILPDQVSPGGVQTWSVYLYPQDVWSRTLPVRIAADYAGWLTNTARATATVGLSATAIVPTFVSIEADLSLGKTGSYVAVPPGAPVTYTLTYFNAGPGVVSGVVITDLLPAAIVNPTVTSTPLVTPVVGTRYAWEVGDISPYMGGEIIIAGFLDTGLAGGLVISNTASVVGLTVDVNPANNHAEAALTVLNVAPGAQADAATTQENTPVTVDVLDNDEDLNGDALTVTGLEGVTQGVVTWSGALVTYTPTASFNGTTVFTYVVTDGALSSRAPVVITVNPTNDPPVAVDDTATTPEDTAVNIAVLSNDSDVDSPSAQWSVTVVGAAASGAAVRQSATMVRYTPNENFNGTDAFTYTMSDGDGGTATAWVTVTVTPVNDPPVAGADFVSTPENTPRLIAVLTNDTDVDGDALILAAVGVPTSGNAAIQGNQVLYTPATGYDGIATFTYTVSDGSASDGGLVTVDVGVPNQAPTAMDDEVTTPEDTPVDIPVLDNDTDLDGDPLFIAALGGTGRAVIVNTFIRYTPANNFYGAESFTYTVSDGLLTDTTWVTVTVTPVNDVPVARADGYSTDTDTVLSVPAPGVLANDTDVEGTALSAFLVSNVTHGALTLRSDGSFIYTPTTGFTGQAVCTYRAYDGEDYSNVATVIIGVDNHPPTASDDAATTDEDVVVDIPVLENDSDPDGNPLSIAAVGSTRAAIVGDDVRYTPAENFHGVESFTYTVSDGVLTDMAWVVVTVLPVNDAPVAVDDAISTPTGMAREIAVLANDLDPDGDPLTLTVVGTPTSGSATIQNNRVLYTPGSGVAVFTYTVSDGALSDTGRVTVTVGVENHAPVAVDDTAATVADTPVDIPVLDNDTDPEGDLLFIAAVGGEHTVIVGNDVRYTPAAGFTGAESFTYTVSDGLLTDTAWVTVTVTAGNRAPVAVDDVIGTPTGVAREIAVLANDLDPDGDPLTLTAVGTPTSGSATIQNNRVLYTPGSGVAVFTYTVSDGALSDTGRVTVTVGVENHAPVAVDDTAATVADTPVDIPVLDNDTDPEGDLLFIAAVGGEHTVIVGNDVSYTPAAGFTGAESFTYTVSDGLLTDTAWVTVAVGLENHAPVAVNDNYATPADTVLLRIAPGVLANDTDADGDALTAYLVGIPLQGQVVLQPDGGFTYTPTLGFTGYDTFTYRVFDALAYSNVAAVRINVGLGNQPPTAADATVNTDEDTPVSSIVSADDPDGDSLNYTVSTTTLYGTVVLTQSTGAWRYTPTNRTATYQDHFQVTVSDGELTAMALITIVVTADNDAPYFTSVQITSATATVAYAYAITAADPDQNDTVGISATVRPAWLTLTGTGATATLQGTPAVADVGSHSVTLEVRDAGGLTALQSFTVTVSEPPQQRIFLPLVLRNAP